MNHRGFYVFLPSNASPKEYPDNKVNHFSVRFEKPISLPNYAQWEMTLIELSYVHSMQTIRGDEAMELVATKDVLLLEGGLIPIDPLNSIKAVGDGYKEHYSHWFYPPNTLENQEKGKYSFFLKEPGTRAELTSRYAIRLGFKQPHTERKLPEGYQSPMRTPPDPPIQKQGQSQNDFDAEFHRYTIAREKYKSDIQIHDNYHKIETDEPPFIFYHKQREIEATPINSETSNQYDFSTRPYETLLAYPKL